MSVVQGGLRVHHAIVLSKRNDEVTRRIRKNYPTCYKLDRSCYLVRSSDLCQSVAVKSGIKGDDRVESAVGAVFRLNGTYAGYASTSLWEWMANEE